MQVPIHVVHAAVVAHLADHLNIYSKRSCSLVGVKHHFQLFLGHFHLSNPVGDKPDTSAPNHPCILVEINKIKFNGLVPRGEQTIWLTEG